MSSKREPVPSTSAFNLASEAACYDSTFDTDDEDTRARRDASAKRQDLAPPKNLVRNVGRGKEPRVSARVVAEEANKDEWRRQRAQILSMSAYDRHKQLVNDYMLFFPGATKMVLQRDSSRDRRDIDVIRENHRFLWDEDSSVDNKAATASMTWGEQLARKYWQKLFKEYCICDLSRYKENKVAMRWRTEKEVVAGKGQFSCGERKCKEDDPSALRTWEVDFGYVEAGEKKNALVKVRLCPDCSYKLNYRRKRKEVTKKSKRKDKKRRRREEVEGEREDILDEKVAKMREEEQEKKMEAQAKDIWKAPVEVEQERSREEDFSEYLEDLFM